IQLDVQVKAALEQIRELNRLVKDELSKEQKPEAAGTSSTGRKAREEREWKIRQDKAQLFVKPLEGLLGQGRNGTFLWRVCAFLHALHEGTRRMLKNEVLNLLRDYPPALSSDTKDGEGKQPFTDDAKRRRDFFTAPEDSYWKLIDALGSFFLRDMMI